MLRCTISRSLSSSYLAHKVPHRSEHTMIPFTLESLNPLVKNVQYAVRGELAIKAEEYRVKLKEGQTLPFKKVISSNIGNPQQKGLDQPPITFTRQVCPRSRVNLIVELIGGPFR